MKLLTTNLPSDCEIALTGDEHEGSPNFVREVPEHVIDWLREKPTTRRFAHMGDAIEAIGVRDKRFEINAATSLPIEQAQAVVERWTPVSGQCLAWLTGNHEWKLNDISQGLTKNLICKPMGVPYGTWTTKVKCVTPAGSFKIYLCHGIGGRIKSNAKDYDQRLANMKATIKMRLKEMAGDAILMAFGHTHLLMVVEPSERLVMMDDGVKLRHHYLKPGDQDSNGYIDPDRRWYANTGSATKLFSEDEDIVGYAERAGYAPIELGYVVATVRGGTIVDVRKVVL
jgi:hypothetical protein